MFFISSTGTKSIPYSLFSSVQQFLQDSNHSYVPRLLSQRIENLYQNLLLSLSSSSVSFLFFLVQSTVTNINEYYSVLNNKSSFCIFNG